MTPNQRLVRTCPTAARRTAFYVGPLFLTLTGRLKMNIKDFEPYRHEILEKRDCGSVVCQVKPRSSIDELPDINEINQFVNGIGFKSDGNHWVEVSKESATKIISRILTADLAYDGEMMSFERAQFLSGQFLQLFKGSPKYLTNGIFAEDGKFGMDLKSWNPISKATFDTGIVCGDKAHLGIIWVEDED